MNVRSVFPPGVPNCPFPTCGAAEKGLTRSKSVISPSRRYMLDLCFVFSVPSSSFGQRTGIRGGTSTLSLLMLNASIVTMEKQPLCRRGELGKVATAL